MLFLLVFVISFFIICFMNIINSPRTAYPPLKVINFLDHNFQMVCVHFRTF